MITADEIKSSLTLDHALDKGHKKSPSRLRCNLTQPEAKVMNIKEFSVGKNGYVHDEDGKKVGPNIREAGPPMIRANRKKMTETWIMAGIIRLHLEPEVEVVGYVQGTLLTTEEGLFCPVQFYADYSKMPVYIPFDFCEQVEKEGIL